MKKVLIIYYTQSGQLKDIAGSVSAPLKEEYELVFEELKPENDFPFPWKGMSFYEPFPECVQEIPCKMKPLSQQTYDDFDLIILAYQVWYLSPSLPFTAFLQSDDAKRLVKGKPVVTLLGVRNMWIMAHERVKKRIDDLGGKLVGNIVLSDKNPNLLTVITIVRWMMKGERHGKGLYGKIFPPAGVSSKDIREASAFGDTILESMKTGRWAGLQDQLLEKGAIEINPVHLSIEKRGFMMFKIWSKFILKKGNYGDPARLGRLRLFKYYLFTVIYFVSPFGSAVIYLLHKINAGRTRKLIDYYSHNEVK